MSEAGVAAIRPVEGPPGHSASRDSARPGALGPRRSQVREVPALTDAQRGIASRGGSGARGLQARGFARRSRLVLLLFEKPDELHFGNCRTEEMTLEIVTPELAKQFRLLERLHALRHDVQS